MNLFLFFYDNFPPAGLILWLFPLSFLYSFIALTISGLLKLAYGWRTGLTRKTFHFLIFIYVYVIQYHIGLPGTFVAGWAVSAVLLYALWRGNDRLPYEAIAREQDAPYRSRYIVYSYLATLGGGVLANLLLGADHALFGYLITGIGDAVAEPVGVLFGKHRYRVINFSRPVSYRSVEGSMSVLCTTALVLILYDCLSPGMLDIRWYTLALCAGCCTVLEALSPQGWDNLVLQVGGSYLVFFWLS